MSENAELEDLDQLVHSAGWVRFTEMVNAQWGGNGARFKDGLVNAARGEDLNALQILRQIIASQREINLVMDMPVQRLKALQARETPPELAYSRRGGL